MAKNPARKVKPIIRIDGNQNLAVLLEEGGHRRLEMQMDARSCAYMAAALSKKDFQVPNLNIALENCLNCLQANIIKVVVYAITDGYFRALMQIKDQREDRTYRIEVNVVDAIISAVIAGCPILVAEEVFKQSDEIIERMGRDFFTLQAQQTFDSMTSGNGNKM